MEKELQIVGFRIGSETYGVRIGSVREIVRVPEITSVPSAPDLIEGVINLRGKIIPVMDLALTKTLAEIHHRNDFSAEIDDTFDQIRSARNGGNLGNADNFAHGADSNTVRFIADPETYNVQILFHGEDPSQPPMSASLRRIRVPDHGAIPVRGAAGANSRGESAPPQYGPERNGPCCPANCGKPSASAPRRRKVR